jgi:hypothetical protein
MHHLRASDITLNASTKQLSFAGSGNAKLINSSYFTRENGKEISHVWSCTCTYAMVINVYLILLQ